MKTLRPSTPKDLRRKKKEVYLIQLNGHDRFAARHVTYFISK